jgi:hypothetical protein
MPAEWRRLRAAAPGPGAPPLERVAFVEHAGTDTQAWVYRAAEARLVVVAFRGTEQVSSAVSLVGQPNQKTSWKPANQPTNQPTTH